MKETFDKQNILAFRVEDDLLKQVIIFLKIFFIVMLVKPVPEAYLIIPIIISRFKI
jgi:hypothetical protein